MDAIKFSYKYLSGGRLKSNSIEARLGLQYYIPDLDNIAGLQKSRKMARGRAVYNHQNITDAAEG